MHGRVEQKTGTDPFVATNDVGTVTLPNGQRFAIAVMVSASKYDEANEAVIARLAKTAWDRFSSR